MKPEDSSPEIRLLSLLALLLGRHQPLPLREIVEELWMYYLPEGVRSLDSLDDRAHAAMRKKFQRDCRALQRLGFRVVFQGGMAETEGSLASSDEEEPGYLLIRDQGPPGWVSLTREEAKTLRLLAGLPSLLGTTPLSDHLRMALARLEGIDQGLQLESTQDDAIAFSLREVRSPSIPPTVSPKVFDVVLEALQERRPVRLTYRSLQQRHPQQRTVEPWGLFQKNGVWYLVGRCRLRNAQRVFTLHRASNATLVSSSSPVHPPPDFSLAQWSAREPWELPFHEAVPVRILLDPAVSGLRHSRLRSATEVQALPDGSVVLRLNATNLEPLLGLLLSLWGHARILDPPEVRLRLESLVDRIVADHQDGEEER